MCESQARPPTSQNGDRMPAAARAMTMSGGDRVVHHVGEWHDTSGHLSRGVGLADTQQDGEVGNDPEQEEGYQSDDVLAGLQVGEDGDGKAGDEPEVTLAEASAPR